MLQAINTRRQSQVIPPRSTKPTNSTVKALSASHANASSTSVSSTNVKTKTTLNASTANATRHARTGSIKAQQTGPKSRPVSQVEFPSSVLPSSRAPSPVPASEVNDEEDSETTNVPGTEDTVVITRQHTASNASAARPPIASESKSVLSVSPDGEGKKDPVKDLENWTDGDWLFIPEGKRKEHKEYVEKVCAGFVDEPEEEDATMVSEYAEEIFQYMSKLEVIICSDFNVAID